MKIMNRLYLIITLAVTVTACYKDKGNYDYNDINQVGITVPGDTVMVKQFDTLKVSPAISESASGGGLTYQWYYFNMQQGVRYDISTDKDVRAVIGAAAGDYPLYLKVTDGKTGVSFYHQFLMKVTSNLPEGWLLLYNTNADSSDAALILPSGQVLSDLYSRSNNKRLAGAAVQIRNYSAQWNKQYIFALTSTNGAYINPLDFRVDMPFDSSFYGANTPLAPMASFPNAGAWFIMDYLFNDNKVYARVWQGPTGRPKFGAPLEGDYIPAPFLMGSPYESFGPYPAVVYDEKNHQFIYTPLNTTAFTNFPNAAGAFSMNNMGSKTLRYAYNTADGRATALFKNTYNDSLFICKMDFTSQRANVDNLPPPVSIDAVAISQTPGMASADFYVLSPDLPLLYYVKGEKVYKYDLAANNSSLVYSFPAGTTITAVSMLDPQKFKPFPLVGRKFAIATLENGEGVMYEFGVANTGSFTGNTYTQRYTAGFGRIASIYYKVPL